MFSIKDKVIVVTGGSGLLGGKIIEVLRGQGAKAISADLKVQDNDELSIKIDITSEQSVRDVVSAPGLSGARRSSRHRDARDGHAQGTRCGDGLCTPVPGGCKVRRPR